MDGIEKGKIYSERQIADLIGDEKVVRQAILRHGLPAARVGCTYLIDGTDIFEWLETRKSKRSQKK